jgi:hypothetical protein
VRHQNKTQKGVDSMRHQEKIKIQRRRRRKLFWLFAATAVSALLFEEQAAVLYVLSALAICGVLMVLAFSNLAARDAEKQASASEKPLTKLIQIPGHWRLLPNNQESSPMAPPPYSREEQLKQQHC